MITGASVFHTSENLSAPVPGDTGANTVSSGTVDNRETQDVREITTEHPESTRAQQHLLKHPPNTLLHLSPRGEGGGTAPHPQ